MRKPPARPYLMEMIKMMTLKLSLKHNCPFTQETAARFAQMLSRYESSVLLCDAHRTINAKSLLGILSLAISSRKPWKL